MKKKKMIWASASLALILGICTLIGIYWFSDRYVDYQRYSKIAQFITAHFPNVKPVTAMQDFPNYDVWIGTGTELEFDFRKNWEEIKVYGNDTIPVSILALIPAEIPKYVAQHYNNAQITKISKERLGYEIKLSERNIELKFNKNGQLIGIDD